MPTPRRYEPRRRAGMTPGMRRTRVTRLLLFVGSIVVTILVAAASIGLVPQGSEPSRDASAAVGLAADNVPPELMSASISEIQPVEADAPEERAERDDDTKDEALPSDSGEGKRVVFSIGGQRVWLVADDDEVETTHLASGSVYDNLEPGTFDVFSRSEQATAYDHTSTMRYFVRFTRGPNAAIGFHDIPVDKSGELVQTTDELGTPLSSGCIRQERDEAIKLWEFAPVGSTVVVLA